jgi:hypothetical protein
MGGITVEEGLEEIDALVNELILVIKSSSLSDEEKKLLTSQLYAIDSDMHIEQTMSHLSDRQQALFIARYGEVLEKLKREIYDKIGRNEWN